MRDEIDLQPSWQIVIMPTTGKRIRQSIHGHASEEGAMLNRLLILSFIASPSVDGSGCGGRFAQRLCRNGQHLWLLALVSIAGPIGERASADIFGSGANSFEIEFVTIGQPGNPPDGGPDAAGAVPYEFRMGKYEISEQMIDKVNALTGSRLSNSRRGPNKPATRITWYDAARFVNWLNTSTGNVPAYKFDDTGGFQFWEPTDPGYDSANL
jgi:hypothetical protein